MHPLAVSLRWGKRYTANLPYYVLSRHYNPAAAIQRCFDEDQNSVLNVPEESCNLEPREDCRMETVLVPRYCCLDLVSLNQSDLNAGWSRNPGASRYQRKFASRRKETPKK